MINLLLPTQKNNVKKEYFARVATVFFVSVFVTSALMLFLLVPVYVSLEDKKVTAEEYLYSQSDTIVSSKESLNNIITNTNRKLLALNVEEGEGGFLVYRDIFKLVVDTRESVRVNSVTYQDNGVTAKILRISGVSDTREELQSFIKRLEGEALFANVNAPVSNFVQGKNIEFSLEITLR